MDRLRRAARALLAAGTLALLMALFPTGALALTPTPAPTFTPTPTGTAAGVDLVVTRMQITSRSSGCPQGPLGLLVTVANIGSAAAGPFAVTANSSPAQTVAGLAAGASASLWFSGYAYGSANSATVDSAGQVAESNESNNTLIQYVPIPTPLYCPTATPTPGTPTPTTTPTPTGGAGRPDLVIRSMRISSRSSGCPQGPLGLLVTVANIGASSAGSFVVAANSNPPQSVPSLAAGASVTLWFSSFSSGSPNSATADATGLVAESNEANNTLSQLLPVPTPLYCPTATPGTPTPAPTATPTPALPTWQPYAAYRAGALVSYAGRIYRCRQDHTALPGRDPAALPTLWLPAV